MLSSLKFVVRSAFVVVGVFSSVATASAAIVTETWSGIVSVSDDVLDRFANVNFSQSLLNPNFIMTVVYDTSVNPYSYPNNTGAQGGTDFAPLRANKHTIRQRKSGHKRNSLRVAVPQWPL